jgi:hypothetical protein
MSFALLSVALLQLTIAAHQFEHSAAYVDDSCHVCIQLDRIDDAVYGDTAPVAATATVYGGDWQLKAGLVSRTFIRGFDSRAPPSL